MTAASRAPWSTPRRCSSRRRWSGGWATCARVLEGMAADDGRSVDRIPILPAAERRQVLREWNATEAAYPARGVRPRAVRGAGRAHARRGGGRVRRRAGDVRGAERAGQPAGAPPPRAGRRPRRAGGDLRGAQRGDGGGAAGHPQGRRRLRSAGRQLPGGAAAQHARGQRPRRPADAPAAGRHRRRAVGGVRHPRARPRRATRRGRTSRRRIPAARGSGRGTWRTCSSPRAPPGAPRG